MGCFESYIEFREEVDKVKKERRQKAVPQPPDDNRSGLFSNTASGEAMGKIPRGLREN